jgi:ribosomal protein L11 methyltransferase
MSDIDIKGVPNNSPEINKIRIGKSITIIPSWAKNLHQEDEIQIRIKTIKAFGDGKHPTTKLCLMYLERHLKPSESLLDIGTGTGILSITAAKLGADPILAIDNDPEAVNVAEMNVVLNRLEDRVKVLYGSIDQVTISNFVQTLFTHVVANISSKGIHSLFEDQLVKTIEPNGFLILTGFLRMQSPSIRARLIWNDLVIAAEERLDDWICIVAKKT